MKFTHKLTFIRAKKLRNKLLFWFLVISIIPLIILYFAGVFMQNTLENNELKNFFQIAESKTNQISNYFKEQKRDINVVAKSPVISDALYAYENAIKNFGSNSEEYSEVESKFKNILSFYATEFRYYDMFLINIQGDIVFTIEHEDDFNTNLITGAYRDTELARTFQQAIEKKEIVLSGFQYYTPSDAPASFLICPVNHGNQLIGFVAVQLKITDVFELIDDYSELGQTGEVLKGRKIGGEAVFINPLRFDQDAAFNLKIPFGSDLALPIQDAVRGNNGSGSSVDYRGVPIIAVWKHLSEPDWGIVVKADKAEVFSPVIEMRNRSIISAIVLLLIAIIIALFLSHSISKPLNVLQAGIKKIGEGELTYKVGNNNRDEIGQLSRSFDEMTNRLITVTASRDELNREIQYRKEAQEQIRLLSKALEENPSTVIISDNEGTITYVNQKFSSETGFSFDETIGQNPRILKSGTQSESFYKELWTTILQGNEWEGEIQNKRKNGELFWQSVSISPLINDEGVITHFVSNQVDISERKQLGEELKSNSLNLDKSRKAALSLMQDSEEQRRNTATALKKLKDSEDQIRLLLNSTAEAIYGIDLHGNCTFVNSACLRILGYSKPGDLIGKNMHKQIHDKYADGTQFPVEKCRIYKAFIDKVGTHVDDEVLWRADGTSFPAEYWSFPQKLGDEILGAVVTFVDITERKKTQDSLKKREAELFLAQQIAKMGNWEYDIVNNITRWSENLFIIYGLIPFSIEPSYEYFRSIMHKDDLRHLDKGLKNIMKNMEPINIEIRVILPNGNIKWIQNKIVPLFKDDKLVSLMGVNIDITESKLLEKQLRKAKEDAEQGARAKSAFLTNMSHEIRTPMNAILGFSEVLSRMVSDNSQKEYVAAIQSGGRTLLGLINNILDKSKIDAGKLDLKLEPVDVHMVLGDLINILKPKAQVKSIELISTISPDIPHSLLLDELRLKQILINLINNAIKFTDDGFVKISIAAENTKKRTIDLVINIEDSGIGINTENQQKIFDAFAQQDDQDNRKYGGTGLGLAISKQLVELMNGTISLESQVNIGSKFTVYLNNVGISKESMVKESDLVTDFDSIHFEKATVLIVDDVESNIMVLEGLMKPLGFEFMRASGGEDALELMKRRKPDIIFSDLVMPGMTGYHMLEKIKENPDWTDIPVIVVTASAFNKEKRKALSCGFDGFIRKPINSFYLLKHLKKHIKYTMVEKEVKIESRVLPENVVLKPEVIADINHNIVPLLNDLQKIRPKKKVEQLAKLISEMGNSHKIGFFAKFGTELKLATESFNVEKEKNLIHKLTSLIEKLRNNPINN